MIARIQYLFLVLYTLLINYSQPYIGNVKTIIIYVHASFEIIFILFQPKYFKVHSPLSLYLLYFCKLSFYGKIGQLFSPLKNQFFVLWLLCGQIIPPSLYLSHHSEYAVCQQRFQFFKINKKKEVIEALKVQQSTVVCSIIACLRRSYTCISWHLTTFHCPTPRPLNFIYLTGYLTVQMCLKSAGTNALLHVNTLQYIACHLSYKQLDVNNILLLVFKNLHGIYCIFV